MPHHLRSAFLGLAALAGAARAAHEPPAINDDNFAVTTKSSGKANTLHVLANDEPAHDGDELKIMRLFTDESDAIPARKLEDYSAPPDDLNEDEHEIAYARPSVESKEGGLCEADGKGLRVKYSPPDLMFEGEDSCGYEACDDEDQCGTAMIYLTVTSPMTPRTASPTRMPVEAPEINDDEYAEAVGITNLNVLDNDVVADSREPLKVMNIIPPHDGWEMIPGTARRRQRRLGETAGYVSASNGWENVKLSEGLEEATEIADEPEIAMVHAGAPSYAGGSCNPTGNRLRVKYYPPAGYEGADMCEYEACDDNGNGVCGRAMIYIAHAASEETKSPTASPTRGSKARKQRSSKGSKEDKTSGGHHKKKKEKRKKAREEKMNEGGDEDGGKETQRTKKLKKKRGEDDELDNTASFE